MKTQERKIKSLKTRQAYWEEILTIELAKLETNLNAIDQAIVTDKRKKELYKKAQQPIRTIMQQKKRIENAIAREEKKAIK